MAKKMLLGCLVTLLTFSFISLSWASTVTGKVVKIEGDFYVVKDAADGKERKLHTDQTTTKEGEVKVGGRYKQMLTTILAMQNLSRSWGRN